MHADSAVAEVRYNFGSWISSANHNGFQVQTTTKSTTVQTGGLTHDVYKPIVHWHRWATGYCIPGNISVRL